LDPITSLDILDETESLAPAGNQALHCSACSLVTTVTELSQLNAC